MQMARCPECGAAVGGSNYAPAEGYGGWMISRVLHVMLVGWKFDLRPIQG